jgi:hypothetical protein
MGQGQKNKNKTPLYAVENSHVTPLIGDGSTGVRLT